MIDDLPELMTPGEVARLFRVDPKTVTRWADEGKLPSIRTLGGHRRYHRADVARHIGPGSTGGDPARPAPPQKPDAAEPDPAHDRTVGWRM